jgi:methylated-DNA-[protein]-cysteine S-methyltransferase
MIDVSSASSPALAARRGTCSTTMPSPVGELRLVAVGDALAAIYFPESRDAPVVVTPPTSTPDHPALRLAATQLAEYFAGERDAFSIPLAPRGTPFQHRVWQALAAIPYGETRSYGEIARVIGSPSASRAVGAANGRNPIPIVVPCHRVIGADGTLTGFGGGLDAKRWLLAHEQRVRR